MQEVLNLYSGSSYCGRYRLPLIHGSIVVNIGGGSINVSLVSLGGIVASKFVDIGGDYIDYDIINIIKNKYDLMIDKETAEYIKINLSSFISSNITNSLSIFGRDKQWYAKKCNHIR